MWRGSEFTPRRSRLRGVSAAAVAVVALLLTPTAATATPDDAATSDDGATSLEASEEQELREFFDEYDVDERTQDELIAKLEAGEPWDSLSGEDPVSTETRVESGTKITIETYADGSVAALSAPASAGPPGEVAPLGVSGCDATHAPPYASYYDNCHADVNLGVVRMGFYFDYECINTVGARITNYWGHHHHIIGGSLSNHRLERWGSSQTQVRYSADFDVAFDGFPVGWTAWMQANVNMCSAWTTNN